MNQLGLPSATNERTQEMGYRERCPSYFLAQRLIEHERRRNPESNKLQLLQNAIYRWDRDRR